MFRRMLSLHPPVEAPIVRPFAYQGSPFAGGLHRGVDLGAPPGARVEAPCDGVVAYAGAHVLTLACGRYRVTLLPLRDVRARGVVARGESLARVGAGRAHAGLHLGVRRAGDPFAYVDPTPLLHDTPSTPLGPAPPPERPRLKAPPRAQPLASPEPGATAPPAAWAGFAAAALAATAGTRLRARRRSRRATTATAVEA
jgi:murein DD-endopeptidase MepM/ murein hydrolase activator NlpD